MIKLFCIFAIGLMWINYPQTAYSIGVALSFKSIELHNTIEMNNQEEIWKVIDNYNSNYKISDLGNVFSVRYGKCLNKNLSTSGYSMVTLSINSITKAKQIHRLVAEYFIPNPDNKPCVNHIDGNKLNNSIKNLEWVTYSENSIHANRFGLTPNPPLNFKGKFGIDHNRSKKVKQYSLDGIFVSEYGSMLEAYRKTGVRNDCISLCVNGKTKTAGGYKWSF